jgi:DNA-binding LacI/PurR family transcriptional regulator
LGSTEIFEPICGEIASLAEEFGFHLLWGGGGKHADLHAEDVVKQAQRYIEEGVDGIFFTPLELCPEYKETNRAVAQKFREAGIPMILLDGDIELPPKRSEFDVISLNNLEVGFSLMNHLMDKGCKKVAFPLASHLASTVNYRWMGAKEAMRQRPEAQLLSVEFEGDIPKLAEEIRAKGFDGVFCYNDALAAPLLMELLRLLVEVPQQLKLCGVDDVKYAQYVRPTLSTYRQPTEAMAHCAVDMMMARIEKPHLPPRKIILQGELVLRGSTGCSADSGEAAQP